MLFNENFPSLSKFLFFFWKKSLTASTRRKEYKLNCWWDLQLIKSKKIIIKLTEKVLQVNPHHIHSFIMNIRLSDMMLKRENGKGEGGGENNSFLNPLANNFTQFCVYVYLIHIQAVYKDIIKIYIYMRPQPLYLVEK